MNYAKKRAKKLLRYIWRWAKRYPTVLDNTEAYERWVKDHGDSTLRLNYELDEDSTVLDLGGYHGQWASDIYAMYNCKVHVFEPVKPFAENIARRFSRNNRIIVHAFGLAGHTGQSQLSLAADSSSVFKQTGPTTVIELIRAADFFEQNRIQKVDLLKINIEGGEYELLEHLVESGWTNNIRNIQVQFHNFVPDAYARMLSLQSNLARSHTLTYQYVFIWENWYLKGQW